MNEERSPLGAAPDDASPQPGEAASDDAEQIADDAELGETTGPAANPHDMLSPAVRRLVRQFDLDITGIHGTGPSGRIRVGDVMGLLGGRTDSGNRDVPARTVATEDDTDALADDAEPAATAPPGVESFMHAAATTVFDCDLSRVLSHRKRLRLDNVELLTTSYFLTAVATALDATPELTAGHPPRLGVSLTTTDGEVRSAYLDMAAVSWDAALDDRVRAVDEALRLNLDADLSAANLLVHHYGESGSVLAMPTPIGPGNAASVGIGRVRREIVVRTVDGTDAPRVTARCHLTLSFVTERIPLHHANRFMAQTVRVLEQWPE